MDDDAPPDVIKVAYRALAKSCHPDFLGQQGHNICILLNEVGNYGAILRTKPCTPDVHNKVFHFTKSMAPMLPLKSC